MGLAAIAAVARNGVIGRDGELPWRLREDLRRFRRLTMGQRLVMGRKTWESIGRALPGRECFVLSRAELELPEGVEAVGDLEEVFSLATDTSKTVFVIGGGEVYDLLMPQCRDFHLTRVEADVAGDTLFPPWRPQDWQEIERLETEADQHNEFPTTYLHLRRVNDNETRSEPESLDCEPLESETVEFASGAGGDEQARAETS